MVNRIADPAGSFACNRFELVGIGKHEHQSMYDVIKSGPHPRMTPRTAHCMVGCRFHTYWVATTMILRSSRAISDLPLLVLLQHWAVKRLDGTLLYGKSSDVVMTFSPVQWVLHLRWIRYRIRRPLDAPLRVLAWGNEYPSRQNRLHPNFSAKTIPMRFWGLYKIKYGNQVQQ